MKLALLKRLIEENKLPDNVIFFVAKKNNNSKFLAEQYIRQIAKNKNVALLSVEDYTSEEIEYDMFETTLSKEKAPFRFYQTNTFKVSSTNLLNEDRLIILTEEITFEKDLPEDFVDFVNKQTVYIPEPEEWQVIDYLMSRAEGLTAETAKWLYALYEGDVYRLDNEINKIALFSEREQLLITEEFKNSDIFEDIPKSKIFDFSNALAAKDRSKLASIYKYKDILIKPRDGEMGFIALLYKTFKNLILVKNSTVQPTPESTGLSEKQIYAIQRIPKVFTTAQVIKIFELLSDMDRKIKNGEFDADYTVDYLIIKIFTM